MQDDEDYGRSLNRDNKHARSSRKIKPMYGVGVNGPPGGKNILKVVQEDDNNNGYLPKSNFMSVVSSPQYQQLASPPRQGKMSSRERNAKQMVNQ